MREMPRGLATVTLTVTALLTLSACAWGADASIGTAADVVDASLAETKASAQLLRNQSVDRLPDVIFQEIQDSQDASIACLDEKVDPSGLARRWRSASTVVVTNTQAARVDVVTQSVVDSFVEQGWTADGAVESTVTLTKDDSTSTVQITATPKSHAVKATVEIAVVGPCVMTAGRDSDEVKQVEGRE